MACFHIPPKLLKFNYQYAFAAVHYVETLYKEISQITSPLIISAGADPGFFLAGGALVSYSTSTPINHIVFFLGRIPVV